MGTTFNNNFKNNKMKKIKTTLLLWAMIALGIASAVGQGTGPETYCPCIPDTNIITIHEKLFDYDVICNHQGPWGGVVPGVYVTIVYRQVKCNQLVTNEIISSTLHTSYFQWKDVNLCNQVDPIRLYADLPNHPNNTTNQNEWWIFQREIMEWAINKFLPPTSNGPNYVSFASGCWASVRVVWPPGTKLYISRGDLGGFDSLTVTHSFMSVPCEGATCCIMDIKDRYNGTIIQGDCSAAIFPAGFIPTIKTINPATGATITYTGVVTQNTGCLPRCIFDPTQSYFTTDVQETKQQMMLTAYPVPFNEFILIHAEKDIVGITLFDSNGRIIEQARFEGKTIYTEQLPKGIYYVQIEFADKSIKSLKVVK
jgi:hypothetical protein